VRNETGTATHSRQREMAAFDKLPKRLRNLLNNAMHNFSAVQIQNELGWEDVKQLIKRLKRHDNWLTKMQQGVVHNTKKRK
jgi:TRAP-type mannitol/chloroaromatic compound transport system substrate-binding protein